MLKYTAEHLTIIEPLDIPETRAFIAFLESEILRHQEDIEGSKQRIKIAEKHIQEIIVRYPLMPSPYIP